MPWGDDKKLAGENIGTSGYVRQKKSREAGILEGGFGEGQKDRFILTTNRKR
jgi:hypothetical protein